MIADMSLAEVLIAGLTAPVSESERTAARKPPYPVPASQVPLQDRVLRELGRWILADGDGPLVTSRIEGPGRFYRWKVDSLNRRQFFNFNDAACALVAVGALDRADSEAVLAHLPSYSGFRRQLVRNRLAANDMEGARREADGIPDGRSWTGYREIAAVLVDNGDVRGFFALWKYYAAGKSRDWMRDLKTGLVRSVARNKGWKAALALTKDKRIGPGFVTEAFAGLPEVHNVEAVYELLDGEAAGLLSELDALTLLANAVRDSAGNDPYCNHPLLDRIVDRIIAIDPTTDKSTMRQRDWLLFALWPAYGEQETLDRARKAIRTPQYKRELTKLPRRTSGK